MYSKETLLEESKQVGPVISGPGAEDHIIVPKLNRHQEECIQKAKKYAAEQGIRLALLKQTLVHQQQRTQTVQLSVQRQQALALMCRIYVGSINFAISEETVKQAFQSFGPIKSISMPYDLVLKKHKGFAFIEYEIPEAATLAVDQMNGVMLCGYSIKVGRPSNMPQAQPIIAQIMEEAIHFSRIYVAAIHEDLSADDIKSVFEAFGRITSCKLPSEPLRPGKHRGYAYIEYNSPQSCIDAVASMNLFDIGGQFLRVCKAVISPEMSSLSAVASSSAAALPTASAIAAAAITAKITALEAVNQVSSTIDPPKVVQPVLYHQPDVNNLTTSPNLIANNISGTELEESSNLDIKNDSPSFNSNVLLLLNMITTEDLDDDLNDEIREECTNFGSVKEVQVHIDARGSEPSVRIFVVFDERTAAQNALSSLDGRFFAGRRITAKLYDHNAYTNNNLTL